MPLRALPALLRPIALVFALALPLTAPAQDVPKADVSVASFGVGGWCRAGDWAAVRVRLRDHATQPREVVVALHFRDADGDRPVYQRTVVTNPAADTRDGEPLWLYARVPFWYRPGDPVTVSAHEARVEGGRYVPDAPIGRWDFPVHNVANPLVGAILVVGRSPAGVDQYSTRGETENPWSPGGHEGTDVVKGVTPDTLPDRWHGLLAFDALVWTHSQVADLAKAPGRADAIKEWVRRGGHLVVVVPTADAAWPGNPASNELFDILPLVTRDTTTDAADLEPLRQLIVSPLRASRSGDGGEEEGEPRPVPLPAGVRVLTFRPAPQAGPHEAVPIFSTPEGKPLVVRRLVGAGAVTLVGIDLASPRFTQYGLPHAEQFWHRVLGRRGILFTDSEANPQSPSYQLARLNRGFAPVVLDRFLGQLIDKKGTAVAGVTLGFVVFLLYWLLAAPLAFAMLKRRNLTQHSWLAFLAAAGVFTAVAWGGATALRPSRISGAHVTLLDHVHGQDAQRARAWMSLLIPWYGDATVTLRDPQTEAAGGFTNLIAPWDRYRIDTGPGGGFPDAREYFLAATAPDTVTFPARSTIKEFQVDWAGGPRWAMPFPVGDAGSAPVRALPRPSSIDQLTPALEGVLRNDLPAPLERVLVVLVRGQRPLSAASRVAPFADADYWYLRDPWEPGQPLDLAALTQRTRENLSVPRDVNQMLEHMRTLLRADDDRLGGNQDDVLEALAFLSQLPPPPLSTDNREFPAVQRSASHGYDLGLWFTQPCVIVVGVLGGKEPADCPVPVFVGDAGGTPRKVSIKGKTVVRWVYPLPPAPVAPAPAAL